ncbi:efflux RND transporter periplasmic adaptor subunit [Thalassotalea sp. Y01]|uniref:efflux RND transporter periplasmic adaptor subunit n=1 Tax=Thalassotalea sp. Y01 TaxID=2729613 RepID=UPI00145E02CD|nr:efflux RND transporter periplasmic adaptor subunit [Thalassotalea sp. Y01]NMP17760.1 efflux RND transporter periplasmic adaptor subunit [Thalassotalea sp. Y01]
MYRHQTYLLLVCTFILSACSPDNEQASANIEAVEKVVQLAKVVNTPNKTRYSFPAEVSAVKTLELSFEVSGRLTSAKLLNGSQIEKGTLLASIDSVPFQRRVNEQKAKRDKAARELSRIKALFAKNLTAQSVLDNAKTDLELADIELLKAEQDLSYTRLYAPFDAQVSERLVDNNNLVSAGQTIATLQDMSQVYFTFNVPERLLTNYKGNPVVSAKATLLNQQLSYDIEYVEHSTAVDPITQTYKVVFAMQPIEGRSITPGARANVDIEFSSTLQSGDLMVPFSALVGGAEQGFAVFKFESNGTVARLPVSVVRVVNGFALIHSSLQVDDEVVAAGANRLSHGMKVRAYKGER